MSYFAIEGLPFAGRTTQAGLFAQFLCERPKANNVVQISIPPVDGFLMKFVLSHQLNEREKILLMATDIMIRFRQFRPDQTIVSDGGITSMCAKTFAGEKLWLASKVEWFKSVVGILEEPTRVIFLDVRPNELSRRSGGTQTLADGIRLETAYHEIFQEFYGYDSRKVVTIDGSGTAERVFERIKQWYLENEQGM